ncbi:MAG: hypothetical protein ACO3YZ_07715, partial [Candidatus Nanopelagicaceae bacterium]
LSHDGQTVSKQVRIGDLVDQGALSMNEYHALASAGMVFMPVNLFTFESVEETAQGWDCYLVEPEPRAWRHTLGLLRTLFPGGRQWQLWLPEPPIWGHYYKSVLVYTPDVLKYKPSRYYSKIKAYSYDFCEGTVTLTEEYSEWVEMSLFKDKDTDDYSDIDSYFADGNGYKFSQDYLVRYYE